MLLNGANIVGVAGLIKDPGALSRKLSTTKCNIGAAAKAQFKNKESVLKLSSEKITAIAEERAAAIAKQRAVGNVSTYGELKKGRPFHDGMDVHHFPSLSFIEKYGIKKNDGLAVVLTKEQHAKTRTYKGKAKKINMENTFRNETALDAKDYIKILKQTGDYNEQTRQSLMKGLDSFKVDFQQLFDKVNKK